RPAAPRGAARDLHPRRSRHRGRAHRPAQGGFAARRAAPRRRKLLMNSAEIVALSDRYLFPTYARAPLALVRGEGARVWDGDGKEYLDFFSSTVVTALGHAHPAITRAVEEQARRILHVSNLHYCEPQARLAEALVKHSFADRVFLCNSGAEA